MSRAPSQSQVSAFRKHLPLQPDPWDLEEEDSGKKTSQLPGCPGVSWAKILFPVAYLIQRDFMKYSLSVVFIRGFARTLTPLAAFLPQPAASPFPLSLATFYRQTEPASRCVLLLTPFHLPIACLRITQTSETTSQKPGRFLPQAFAPQVNIQTLSPDNRRTFSVLTRCQAFFCAPPVLIHLILTCGKYCYPYCTDEQTETDELSNVRHT